MIGGLMFRRSRRTSGSERAPEALATAAALVDAAKRSLLSAVPGGRRAGAPVAEALAGFEEHLRTARSALERWPSGRDEALRNSCTSAVDESLRRAEALRLKASPQGYEELYSLLGEILDPLVALAESAGRLRGGSC
jgi:hypothetical protein